ncbi:MAG TPA: hypothetical protein VGG03_22810 [Thermoanaerobaculia bacterium]|jgi:hypothetical protein
MKRHPLVWLLLAATILAGAAPAAARTCSLDVVPAATLLLPYFEVDLGNASGRTTLISIINATDRAALARVVLWTDLGVPTLAFDVYLTGYDVQTINLRDLFAGRLPRTASASEDPSDDISPHPQGGLAQDVAFPGCAGLLPPADLSAPFVEHLQRVHRGFDSPLLEGKCAAQFFGDALARGYATVDVVRRCSTLTPADAGYFGPDGVAGNDNVLWGDFYLVDPAGNLAQGENLVRIESDPARFAGRPTFYGRYVGSSGADGREPLPTVWGARFINGGAFTGGTDFLYWRDSRVKNQPFPCNQRPAWFPIPWEFERTTVFDEQESVDRPGCVITCPPPPPSPFPAESGRVAVDSPALPVPFEFGWWHLDMKTNLGVSAPLGQSWLGALHDAQNLFSVGLEAEPFDSGCAPRNLMPGIPPGSN